MGKLPHFTFCFMYWFAIFEAEFLSFCCCTELCQKNQQRRGKWKSLSLHSKVSVLQLHWGQLGNMKNLHRHTLLTASFRDPKSAFKTGSSAWNRRGMDSLCSAVERKTVLQSASKPEQAEEEPDEQMEAEFSDFHKPQWGLFIWVRIFNEQLAAAMVIVSTCCLLGFQFKLLLEIGFGFTGRVWNYSYMLQPCTISSGPQQELGVVVTEDFDELKHACGHQTYSKS